MSEKIRILSRYTTINILRYFLNILSIIFWKAAGAFVRLNGITKYLYRLNLVRKAIFYILESAT
jgi:hypothetical protein